MSKYIAKGALLLDAKRRVNLTASLARVARLEYELALGLPVRVRAFDCGGYEFRLTPDDYAQCARVVESVRDIAAQNFVYAR
jgi:hypothetical protein